MNIIKIKWGGGDMSPYDPPGSAPVSSTIGTRATIEIKNPKDYMSVDYWILWSLNAQVRPSICPESSGTVPNFNLYICPVTDTPKSLDCPGNSANEVAREK